MHLRTPRVLARRSARAFRNTPPAGRDIASTFLRWAYLRAVFHRGYVLVSIDRVLTARARRDLAGSATGMLGFGVLGWTAGLATAVVASGAGMALVGLIVAKRFTEDNFTPVPQRRWRASLSIFRRGLTLSLRDREIRLVLAATLIS